jgi:hypothetical protein
MFLHQKNSIRKRNLINYDECFLALKKWWRRRDRRKFRYESLLKRLYCNEGNAKKCIAISNINKKLKIRTCVTKNYEPTSLT